MTMEMAITRIMWVEIFDEFSYKWLSMVGAFQF